MILQQRNGMVRGENPVVEWSLGTRSPRYPRLGGLAPAGPCIEQRSRRSVEQFFGPKLLQLFLHAAQRAFTREFRRAKLPGGTIQSCEAHPLSHLRQSCEKIIFFRTQGR